MLQDEWQEIGKKKKSAVSSKAQGEPPVPESNKSEGSQGFEPSGDRGERPDSLTRGGGRKERPPPRFQPRGGRYRVFLAC